jgi:hypothetical protein
MLLHPLFPHVHGDLHSVLLRQGIFEDDEQQTGPLAVDQAPGISAGASSTSPSDVLSGLVLPLSLSLALVEIWRRLVPVELRPDQHEHAPPSPPPRLAVTLA